MAGEDLERLLEPFLEDALACFPFKRKDLLLADERVDAFLVILDFDLAFVAIGLATYTGYTS